MDKSPIPEETGAPRRADRVVAEHIALEALGPYDAAPEPRRREADVVPQRQEMEEGRLLRLALLPFAGWGLAALLGLPADETLCAAVVAGLLAVALGLRR